MHLLSKTNHIFLLAALVSAALISACGGSQGTKPDVSDIAVKVNILRFDQAIFAIDTNQMSAAMAKLQAEYPTLLPLFAGNIIQDRSNPDETQEEALRDFVSIPELRHLYDTVQQVYGDLRNLEKNLTPMFQYYRYYFPQKPVPQVVAMVSEFATDAFTYGDSLCGIGLDMFLGENYPGYDPEIFPAYIRRQFHRDYIPVRLARALAQNLADAPPGDRLIDQMLYNGKALYITDLLLPDTPDSIKMGYTRAQIEGCKTNEQALWARLLEQNLLYSTDFNTFRKLVTPSPNAPVAFAETPGEAGNWLGWQIVKAYMSRHPNTPLDQLLQMHDAQQFLEQAKYKPRR